MSNQRLDSTSPGAILARTREEHGVSQREVADALHLPMHVVDAIESGDKERLPAHVFTRGYVRAYAKLLELDPDPLVTAFTFEHQEPGGQSEAETVKSEHNTRGLWQRNRMRVGLGAGALVIAVVVISLFTSDDSTNINSGESSQLADQQTTNQPNNQRNNQRNNEPNASGEPSLASELMSSEDTLEGFEEQGSTDDVPGAVTASVAIDVANQRAQENETGPEGAGLILSEAPTLSPEPVIQEPELVVEPGRGSLASIRTNAPETGSPRPTSSRRITPEGGDRLVLSFAEDCWLEIKTPDGQPLYADLGQAGQRREFVGQGPFRLLLGYAPGATLEFNSEVVALAPYTRNNVATLVVGQ